MRFSSIQILLGTSDSCVLHLRIGFEERNINFKFRACTYILVGARTRQGITNFLHLQTIPSSTTVSISFNPLLIQMNPSKTEQPEIAADLTPIKNKNRSRKRECSNASIPTTISSEMDSSQELAPCEGQTMEKAHLAEVEAISKPLPRKRTLKDFLPKYVQLVMLLVFIAVFFSIQMMPSKYMVCPLILVDCREIPKVAPPLLLQPWPVLLRTLGWQVILLGRTSMTVISSIKTAQNSSIPNYPMITSLVFPLLQMA